MYSIGLGLNSKLYTSNRKTDTVADTSQIQAAGKEIIDLGIPASSLKRIVIIGGGFAGINLIKKLSSEKFQIVLLDKNNYHQFQPLLYQVAMGGLEPSSIAYPLRKILKSKLLHYRMAEVKQIHPEENYLDTSEGRLNYDYLVIATGSKSNFYGNESIAKNALTLKSIPDALDIRSWLFQNLEAAVLNHDMSLSTIVIVGGGPTGVEIAGALAEIKNHVLPKDYPELQFQNAKIYLIESGDKVLGVMSETASKYAEKYLRDMNVNLMLNQRVENFSGTTVSLAGGETIETHILIWTAGVLGHPIAGLDEKSLLKSQRYIVDSFNRIVQYENIFAVGDTAAMKNPEGESHPMLAPVAIQQAGNLANNLNRNNPEDWKEFYYFDKGVLATVGRNKALADFGSLNLHGLFAWLIWVFVHLMTIVGFRNRLFVFTNWVMNYFSFGSAIRLIIRPIIKKGHNTTAE
jgi:NADH:ubiquinone reductase (H+-translocating)